MSELTLAPAQVPAGRCLKCGSVVPLSDTFTPGNNGQGERRHRISTTGKNPIGEVCGPVVTALLFHVIAQAGSMILRIKMPSLQHPEENYDEVIQMWERAIASSFRAQDEKGAMIIGAQAPPVVVTSWKHVGAQP